MKTKRKEKVQKEEKKRKEKKHRVKRIFLEPNPGPPMYRTELNH